VNGVPEVLWTPPADAASTTAVGRFAATVAERHGAAVDDYGALWRWSVTHVDDFWRTLWNVGGVQADGDPDPVRVGDDLPGTRWFPGTALNWAEHALHPDRWGDGRRLAVISRSQTRPPVDLTMAELRAQVARARAGLAAVGVGPGTRVAAYLPTIPEALVALLATASLGATWTSCAPEFGVRSVVDRLGQVGPRVLLAIDGYRYGDRVVDRHAEVAELRRQLPTVTTTVHVPYLHTDRPPPPGAITWQELLAHDGPLAFDRVPFAHPLYVLYSSGTTGLPKPIVHGHGGMLLAHLRDLGLHHDLGPGDRFCWFTTTGWMMWNYLMSGLLVGATVVCFDGDPGHPDLHTLWRLAGDVGVTLLGVSAPFLMACRAAGVRPGDVADLGALRAVGSTGAPLPAAGARWVVRQAVPGVLVASISGGTDICSIWVGHAPTVPVWAGEISCRALGAAVAAYDPDARPVVGTEGELVVTEPVPSMPVGLWGDDDGSRYRATYFSLYPGVWSHGDWVTVTDRGSCVISGRSDATLNRGGVRIGTAELYAVVEGMPQVADSLAVHLEDDGGGPGQLVLFVVPAAGVVVDEALRRAVADELRRALSPRHVPDRIEEVTAVPRTLSGKKLEVPVKRILRGDRPEDVAAAGALADPGALDQYAALARRLAPRSG
jgi:acetoacetyl-CoA synthetase